MSGRGWRLLAGGRQEAIAALEQRGFVISREHPRYLQSLDRFCKAAPSLAPKAD